MSTKPITNFIIQETLGIVFMGGALFLSAGRIDWWAAWAALAIMAAWTMATLVIILRVHPDLLAERLGSQKGAKPWDIRIVSILGISQLVGYVIAGLDQRFGWTGGIPISAQFVALAVCVLGYALFVWATISNPFFSQFVRIKTQRGHSVVTGGPYHYVRHPAYIGAIFYELAAPILLASWLALIVGIFNAFLLTYRTTLEDRTLNAELNGYVEYSSKVPYRLLPGIW